MVVKLALKRKNENIQIWSRYSLFKNTGCSLPALSSAALTMYLIHKSHNAPVPYPKILHSEQKCAHFCSEWSILGYETGAFWDLWNWSILSHGSMMSVYRVNIVISHLDNTFIPHCTSPSKVSYGVSIMSILDIISDFIQLLNYAKQYDYHLPKWWNAVSFWCTFIDDCA